MIGSSLLRYQDNQKYLIFDTETEGLNLARARPWQIAYATYNNKGVEKIIVKYPFWKDINVSSEAAYVTRFNKNEYLALAEDPKVILKEFEEIAMDPNILICGHNILGFDIYVWKNLKTLCGQQIDWSFMSRMVDTLCLSRAYRHNIKPDLENFIIWQYKMLTLKKGGKGFGASLGAMAREFEIGYNEKLAHDAKYDCDVNYKVFKKLIWSIEV